jgi:hypothetical protein
MKTIGTIQAYGQTLELKQGTYRGRNGAIAISLTGTDEDGFPAPYGALTVSIPGVQLAKDEILVKTWGENEEFRTPALTSGLFQDTGRRVPTGFVAAEVWKLTGVLQ